jgi:hypothetical protein
VLADCVATIARAGSTTGARLLERTNIALLPARPNILFVLGRRCKSEAVRDDDVEAERRPGRARSG